MRGAGLPVVGVRLIREETLDFPTPANITGPADAARILAPFLQDRDREHFVCLLLDTKHRPMGVHVAHVGTLNMAPIHPREVFKAALLANAARVILAHNHPSGDPTASQDDIRITTTLADAGALLGVEVLDSLIIGAGGAWRSLRQAGQLAIHHGKGWA